MKKNFLSTALWLGLGISFTVNAKNQDGAIRFSYSAGKIEKKCKQEIDAFQAWVDDFSKRDLATLTFQKDFLSFENRSAELSDQLSPLIFMAYTSKSEVIRKEAEKCEASYGSLWAGLVTRSDLYERLKKSGDSAAHPVDQRLVKWTLLSFEKNGMHLDDHGRNKVKAHLEELSKLTTQFSANLNSDTSSLSLTLDELAGVPAHFVKNLPNDPKNEKLKILRAKRDAYEKVMTYAKNPETRKKMLNVYFNRQAAENTPLLSQALFTRYQLAKLLGKKNWAEVQLQGRMAKTVEGVESFLKEIHGKIENRNKELLTKILRYKQKEFPDAQEVDAWDTAYYLNQIKEQEYQVDAEKVSEYFPANESIDRMLKLYSKLFGVRFQETRIKNWDDGVRHFEIRDGKTGKVRAYFYMDLYPRDGKYGHFAAFPLISGRQLSSGKYSKPVAAIVGNFPKPTQGKPSCLNHGMLETLYHEFGHIMHQTLTTVPYATLSGSSVLQDFVEAPSQMLENWVWEPSILTEISSHYKTKKPLPLAEIERVVKARSFDAPYAYSRQLVFAKFDMAIHSAEGKVDPIRTFDSVFKVYSGIDPLKNSHFPASFGHMMGGYDAGYYGYLWSEVYAQDLFSRFKKEGLKNTKVGLQYRDGIIALGNTEDPLVLIQKFLGREPKSDAFFETMGL